MSKTALEAALAESSAVESGDGATGESLDYDLYEQVGHLLRRAHQRATSVFQEHIGEPDLTPLQFAALVKIHEAGEISQNRLGRLTAMDQATVHGVIRRLLEKALIRRGVDPRDRRRTRLTLTTAGRKAVLDLLPHALDVSARTLAPLAGPERATFVRLLKKLC